MAAGGNTLVICAACLALCACQSTFDPAKTVRRPSRETSSASWKAKREQNVVMQQHDYSCGAASLATLLKFYFGEEKVTEQELLAETLSKMTVADIEDRQHRGLSLLDLRDCARRRGYTAEGLKLDLADLEQLDGPVLVHMIRDELPHFAILRGVRGGKAFLADPSYGNLSIQTAAFAKEWTGYILAVDKPGHTAPADNPLAIDASGATSAPVFQRTQPSKKDD